MFALRANIQVALKVIDSENLGKLFKDSFDLLE